MADPRPRTTTPVSRRLVLGAGSAGALGLGAVALAGCSSASAPAAAAPGSTTPPAAGTSPSAGAALATLADVPVGGAIAAELDGKPVLVAQPTAGTAVCFSAICPHQGCTVAPGATTLQCPCHGSTFDPATGAVLSGPARSGLTAVTVSVVDGSVTAS